MTSALQQSKFGRFITLAALALSAMATVGCSVPPVNGTSSRKQANSSYDDCVVVLSTYGREGECSNTAPRTTTTTYTQYSKTYAYSPNVPESEIREAYLASLDDASVSDLKEQWSEMASEVKAEAIADGSVDLASAKASN